MSKTLTGRSSAQRWRCLPWKAAGQDLTSLSLEDLMKIKIETVSLHPQSAAALTGLVTIITSQQIRQYGYRTLGEALDHVSGLYLDLRSHVLFGGRRGIFGPGDWASRILVLVNGHTMNDNIFGVANYFGDDFVVDMSLVDRIEVVRGPSSALYGSNGILATINVITKNPDNEHGTSVATEADLLGEKKVTLTQAIHLGRNSSLLLSGSAFNTTGSERHLHFSGNDSPATNNGNAVNMDGSRGYRFFADFKSGNWEILSVAGSRQKDGTGSWATRSSTIGAREQPIKAALLVECFIHARNGFAGPYAGERSSNEYEYHGIYHDALDDGGIDVNHEFDAGDWAGSELSYRFPWLRGNLTAGAGMQIDLRRRCKAPRTFSLFTCRTCT